MSSDKEELEKMNGVPIYTPKNIFVLMNDETFSAAFHYAFFLWRMGATIVGIPCRQAPNTYMEQTPFELPYTRLKGSISNSIQIFLPGRISEQKYFIQMLFFHMRITKNIILTNNQKLCSCWII